MARRDSNNEGSNIRRRLLNINDQIDSIQDASFRNYTRNIESRFHRLAEQQARMISETYDQLSREERARARVSIREQQDQMRRSLENWRRYNNRMSEDLSVTERFATKLFYWNRRRDLRNLEREARYRFQDIADDAEELEESLTDSFGRVAESLRDWSTALNVNSLVSDMEDATQSTRDIYNQLKKSTSLTKEEWDDLKQTARDFSKETDYAISNIDYLSEVSDIIIKLGIDDTQLAKDMAKLSTKFGKFTGLELEDQAKMLETSQLDGMGGIDYQRLISSQMMAIQAAEGLNTSGADLMKVYSDNIDMFRDLSNGNRDLLNQYTNSSMALTTAGNAGYIEGLDEQLYEIMNMSLSDLADKMEGGQFYLKDVHDLMQSGAFDQAAKAFIEGYNELRNQMIASSGIDGWKELAKEMDLEGINESQIIETSNVQDFFEAYDRSMQLIDEQINAQTKYIDSYIPSATWGEKITNWWKSSWLGDNLDNLLNDLDLSLSEVFLGISAITDIAGMVGKAKGGSGLLGKLGGLFKGGAAGGGLLSSLGGSLFAAGGNLVEAGGATLGTGASATVGGTTALGAGSILGGLLGAVGIGSGIYDIYKGATNKDLSGKEKQDKYFSGGTKIGMVGAGAGAGAAIGSVVPGLGTAVGALVGAGVGGIGALISGTKVGKALSDAWDWTSDKASDLWDDVSDWGSKTWNNVKNWAGNTWDSAKSKASDMWSGAKQLGIDAFNTAVGTGDIAMENLFNAMGLDWGDFKTKVAEGWTDIKEWGTETWSNISSWAGEKWDWISEKASGIWDNISSKATEIWTSITTWAGEKWDWISEKAGDTWDGITEFASDSWDSIKTTASDVWDGISEKASDVWDGIKKGASKAFDSVKDKAGDIWGGIKEFFSGAKSRGESITGIDGSHKNGLDTVPKDGYIAELHKDEAVLTAEQARKWRAEQNASRSTGFFHNVWKNAKLDREALIQSYKNSLNSGSSSSTGTSAVGDINVTGNNKSDIWNFLKQQGLTDYASAGVMGCWEAESGNNPNRVEGDYLSGFPGIQAVTASKEALSSYAQNVLFPAYARSGISINKSAYKGSDGYYYPGFGLAQWTGPRVSSLVNYASANGGQWYELATQLGFFWKEFSDRNLKGTMNAATSAADATAKFFDGFEMFAGASSRLSGEYNKRVGYANSYYNQFAGASYDTGTPWVPNDQVALIHKGEMIVPAEANPYNKSNSSKLSESGDSTIDDLIQVVKWGVSRIEKAINNSNQSSGYNLANMTRTRKDTASDELFGFASA